MKIHLTMTKKSMLALALIGTSVAAAWSAGHRASRAKEKVRSAAAIDSWEDEGGGCLTPVRTTDETH